jgi:hypothetical protein
MSTSLKVEAFLQERIPLVPTAMLGYKVGFLAATHMLKPLATAVPPQTPHTIVLAPIVQPLVPVHELNNWQLNELVKSVMTAPKSQPERYLLAGLNRLVALNLYNWVW